MPLRGKRPKTKAPYRHFLHQWKTKWAHHWQCRRQRPRLCYPRWSFLLSFYPWRFQGLWQRHFRHWYSGFWRSGAGCISCLGQWSQWFGQRKFFLMLWKWRFRRVKRVVRESLWVVVCDEHRQCLHPVWRFSLFHNLALRNKHESMSHPNQRLMFLHESFYQLQATLTSNGLHIPHFGQICICIATRSRILRAQQGQNRSCLGFNVPPCSSQET